VCIRDDATDALLLHATAFRQLQGSSCKTHCVMYMHRTQTAADNVATRSCTITHKNMGRMHWFNVARRRFKMVRRRINMVRRRINVVRKKINVVRRRINVVRRRFNVVARRRNQQEASRAH
jgi:hypothetical protein